MRSSDHSRATWHKSSHSNDGGDGVEVAEVAGRIAMRDSKDPAGLALVFTHAQWRAFLDGVQTGDIN